MTIENLLEQILKELKKLNDFHSNNENFSSVADSSDNNILTVKQFCLKHTFITESGLRKKIFNREWNKFSSCISQCGRRILIKEKETIEYFTNPPIEADWTYDRNKYERR